MELNRSHLSTFYKRQKNYEINIRKMPSRFHSKSKYHKLLNRKQWLDWYTIFYHMQIIFGRWRSWKNINNQSFFLCLEGTLSFIVETTFSLSILCIFISRCSSFSLIVPFRAASSRSCSTTNFCISLSLQESSLSLLLLRLDETLFFLFRLFLIDTDWKYYSLGCLFSQ